jgi:hypothetical protein
MNMGDVVYIGDEVRLIDGTAAIIRAMDRRLGMFWTDDGRVVRRYDFRPAKWDGDKIGTTNLGVCAACSNQGVTF